MVAVVIGTTVADPVGVTVVTEVTELLTTDERVLALVEVVGTDDAAVEVVDELTDGAMLEDEVEDEVEDVVEVVEVVEVVVGAATDVEVEELEEVDDVVEVVEVVEVVVGAATEVEVVGAAEEEVGAAVDDATLLELEAAGQVRSYRGVLLKVVPTRPKLGAGVVG